MQEAQMFQTLPAAVSSAVHWPEPLGGCGVGLAFGCPFTMHPGSSDAARVQHGPSNAGALANICAP